MKNDPLRHHVGIAAPLIIDNIDTDQIIPSREMNKVSRKGLGQGLFAGWRYRETGSRTPNPDFILNQSAYTDASILLAGANFGCGSSREHAVWAIREFGIRVIIARTFGEIFHANCAQNGVLAIVLPKDQIEMLVAATHTDPQSHRLVVDLAVQTVSITGAIDTVFSFEFDAYQKKLLMEGLDPIRLTLSRRAEIAAFRDGDRKARPWVYE